MTRTHRLTLLTLAALATLCAPLAQAQDDSYNYIGLGAGQSRVRIDDNRIAESLRGSGLTTTSVTHDGRDTAYKVFLGRQFNRHFGLELGYFHLGGFGFGATTVPAGRLDGDFRVQGGNLDLVATLPFTERLSGLARVGAQYARTRTTLNTSGAVTVADNHPSDRKTNAKIGLGLQYAFNPGFLMRAEVERLRISDAVGNHPRVALYTVSMVFPFGRSAGPSRRAEAPAYVAAAPAAAPMPAPLAPPVAPPVAPASTPAPMAAYAPAVSVSYDAESLFGFDRSELQPQGRAELDGFATRLQGTSYNTITVKGHADRLGSTAYNQTLSLARAEAVKAYLVRSGRLDAARITTIGMSEEQPVTLPDECRGAMSERVVTCLQPDRRVDIHVDAVR